MVSNSIKEWPIFANIIVYKHFTKHLHAVSNDREMLLVSEALILAKTCQKFVFSSS